jgi:hypothetical protein
MDAHAEPPFTRKALAQFAAQEAYSFSHVRAYDQVEIGNQV